MLPSNQAPGGAEVAGEPSASPIPQMWLPLAGAAPSPPPPRLGPWWASTPPLPLRRAPHPPTPSSASCRSRQVRGLHVPATPRTQLPGLATRAVPSILVPCLPPALPPAWPCAAYVVERFGKYSRTLTPGLHILIPIVSLPLSPCLLLLLQAGGPSGVQLPCLPQRTHLPTGALHRIFPQP